MKTRILCLTLTLLSITALAQVEVGYTARGKGKKIRAAAFSPNGNKFVFASGNKLNVTRKGTAELTNRIKTPFSSIYGLAFIDETKVVAWGIEKKFNLVKWGLHNTIIVTDIDSGTIATIDLSPIARQIEDIEVINDTLFALVSKGSLALFNPNTAAGKVNQSIPGNITDIFYDHRSKILYSIHRDGSLNGTDPFSGSARVAFNVTDRPLMAGAVSGQGKDIVVSDVKGYTYFLEKRDSLIAKQGQVKGNKGPVYNVAFSADDQYFVTSDNKRVVIFTNDYNRPIKKLKYKGAGTINAVAFDPKGDFLAVGGYLRKKVRLYNTSSLNIVPTFRHKNKNDQNPPQIMVTQPSSPSSTITINAKSVQLKGLAVDDYGLSSLKINGQELAVSSTGDFSMDYPLTVGDNLVTIEATDVNDNVAVKKLTIKRDNVDLLSMDFEVKNHLLIISIDKYEHWPALSNAVSDAEKLMEVLKTKYQFEDDNIIVVSNEKANRNGILEAFKKLVEQSGPNDNIIIYYSGHGYFDPTLGEGYWIPVNAAQGAEGDYFSNTFMLQLIKRLQSKHVFLVADACFSGSLFAEAHRGYTENVGQYKSRWGLASGRLEFVSDGSAGEQSPFNKHLVEYLENSDQEEFSVSQLIQYVKIKVANETNQTPIGNPLRNTGDEGGEFVFKKKTQ